VIKCKEDLIDTAVFCHKGELRELYLKKCEQFGVSWNHAGLDINKYSLLMVDENTELQGVICCNDDFYLDLKRLTLSDLKPRTRTEYEKVSFVSVGDCVQSVHDNYGEYFFLNNCSGEYQAAEYQDSAWYWNEGNLYRRVEKEIDERQEFIKEASKIWNRDDMHCSSDIFREMYDSGKFKFIG
jgi:hypothetical protein